jgi:hypothetical protein
MKRGIYITANDKFTGQAIALLNSIRLYDQETPVVLIPYDDNYEQVAKILAESFGVKLYGDLQFINNLSNKLYEIFGQDFFARPNQFRKQACWFGEFDQFLYIDTDIVVFEKIIDNLDYFIDYDFLCCDYQHKAGIKNVFTKQILEEKVLSETDLQDVFNCGFWGAKKNLISESELYETFAECAKHPEYFDFSQKTSDQPIINYLILKRVQRRFNLVRKYGKGPGNWAGSPHFQRQGNILIDPKVNLPLQYLHWAGIRLEPGCPYWDIWKYYRYLNEPEPPEISPIKSQESNWVQLINKIKKKLFRK